MIEVIRLRSGDLAARGERSQHVAIANVATQPLSPAFTPEALREKAAAYAALADEVEARWDEYADERASAKRASEAFKRRIFSPNVPSVGSRDMGGDLR